MRSATSRMARPLGFGGFAVVGMPINLYGAVAMQGARNLTCVPNSMRVGASSGRRHSAFYTPAAVGTELAEGREIALGAPCEHALPLDYAFVRACRADGAGNLRFRAMSERAKGLSRQQM